MPVTNGEKILLALEAAGCPMSDADIDDRGVVLLKSIHPVPRNNARNGPKQVQAVFRESFELVRGEDVE